MASADAGAWLGEHLFLNAGIYTPECDRVVLDVVKPFVERCRAEGWIDGFFFIRFGERGPHVRLRLHGDPRVLEDTVRPALRDHLSRIAPGVVEGWPDGTGEPGALTHVQTVEYEPETDRYGGPDGVRLAEDVFERSSETAFVLLSTVRGEHASRLGKALLAMVLLTHVFTADREEGAAFARRYGLNYLRALAADEEGRSAWLGAFDGGWERQAERLCAYVDDAWERLDAGESLSETLDRHHADLREVRRRFDALFDAGRLSRGGVPFASREAAVEGVVPSYLHMTSNRLGVTIHEESYLAYLVARALGGETAEAGASQPTAEGR